jgi:hypothetical protein
MIIRKLIISITRIIRITRIMRKISVGVEMIVKSLGEVVKVIILLLSLFP